MAIIVCASTKGGPGKTTLAMSLAGYWRAAGLSVATLDADPNKNLAHWVARAGQPFPCKVVSDDEIVGVADAADREHDVVIVDVAGSQVQGLVFAVGVADLVLIPTKPDLKDVTEAVRTQQQFVNVAIQSQARRIPGFTIPHYAVLMQVNRRANVTEHSRQQLAALGLPALKADLPLRTAYSQASYQGESPIVDPMVREDVAALVAEITDILEQAHGGE